MEGEMKISGFIEASLTENTAYIREAIQGLTAAELAFRPEPHSNSIAFLLWHVARVEDFWVNGKILSGKEIYESADWYQKFGTAAQDFGFGYDIKKLEAWTVPSLELLLSYAAAVRLKTLEFLKDLNEGTLDIPRDFGRRKGTNGSALSHLITEVGEHAGQIGYIKGMMKGIAPPPNK
jgi:uncharacterized damage-inducible protein DinB